MKINASTKIAALLKHHPDALEAIVGIAPQFSKLRNPMLRKLLAGRTSIAMASKVGGCKITEFFEQLRPLGFEVEGLETAEKNVEVPMPGFLRNIEMDKIQALDVRPILDADKDPLKQLLELLRNLKEGHVLKVINTFEPSPLIALVEKKGFLSYVKVEEPEAIVTYFYKASQAQEIEAETPFFEEWEGDLKLLKGDRVEIDVRDLPMPQPMMTILEALEKLKDGQALFVQHKKMPLFLLPELKERGYEYRIKEVADHHVQLLIFKNETRD